MQSCLVWNEVNIAWNVADFAWNLCEVILEVPSTVRGIFIDPRKKRHSERWKLQKDKKTENNDDKRYVKVMCLINDEMFQTEKYIGRKVNVKTYDEEFVISEIRKINVSIEDMNKISKNNVKMNNRLEPMENIIVLKEEETFTELSLKK